MKNKLKAVFLLEILYFFQVTQSSDFQAGCSCDVNVFTPSSQGCLHLTYISDGIVQIAQKCVDINEIEKSCSQYRTQYSNLISCSLASKVEEGFVSEISLATAVIQNPKKVTAPTVFAAKVKIPTERSDEIIEAPVFYDILKYNTLDPKKSTTPSAYDGWIDKPGDAWVWGLLDSVVEIEESEENFDAWIITVPDNRDVLKGPTESPFSSSYETSTTDIPSDTTTETSTFSTDLTESPISSTPDEASTTDITSKTTTVTSTSSITSTSTTPSGQYLLLVTPQDHIPAVQKQFLLALTLL